MRKAILLLVCIIYVPFAFGVDDFGEEESIPTRKVVLREGKLSKQLSLFSIQAFQGFDKYILYPISVPYTVFTTKNFRVSVKNLLSTISSLENILNNALIGSPQRFMASSSSLILNLSLGVLGTANLSQEFEVAEMSTTTANVLRFYGMPESYFVTITAVPFTLPATVALPIDIYKSRYSPISLTFILSFGLNALNERALYPEAFDLFQKLDSSVIYENIKNKTYAEAKYFKIETKPFKNQSKILREHYKGKEFLL